MKSHYLEEFTTTEGYIIKVVEYFNFKDCSIKFQDSGLVINKVNFNHVKKGNIKNPFHKSVCGVGYIGVGNYKTKINSVRNRYYEHWRGMIRRCYSNEIKHKVYQDCSVTEEWHNFQNFAKWYEENYNPKTMEGWHLDKDILVKGNKIYSPETCCFVPDEVNKLILKSSNKRGKYPIGVTKVRGMFISQCNTNSKSRHISSNSTIEGAFRDYKTVKEQYIKEVAHRWKDTIPKKVYQALYDWEIKITD